MTSELATTSRMLRSALVYAGWGWPVFPLHTPSGDGCSCGNATCGNRGKHPRTRHGFKEATTDVARITEWWRKWPDANIGVSTGKVAGIVVADIDPRNGGDESFDSLGADIGGWPDTVTALTGGGGRHLVFKYPSNTTTLKPRVLARGIDFKSDGGYIVVAPSLHASGREYAWEASSRPDDMKPAELPGALLRKLGLRAVAQSAPGSGSAAASLLGRAFAHAGMLGKALPDGKISVVCPWTNEHTGGEPGDSSTCIFPPKEGATLGGFLCLHGHCAHRTYENVLKALPADAVERARADVPPPHRGRAAPPRPAGGPAADADGVVEDPGGDWRERLIRSKQGFVVACTTNAALILRHDEAWAKVLGFDGFADMVVKRTPAPWTPDEMPTLNEAGDWIDKDDERLAIWFHRMWGLRMKPDGVRGACAVAADTRQFHPVREYLDALVWDGTRRVPCWLATYLGVQDGPYPQLVGQAWLVAAVARIYDPGCKVDTMLVLEGDQGVGKSRALSKLFSAQWTNDTTIDLQNKDRFDALRRKWLIEFAELDSFNRAEKERVKAFITSPVDNYRPAYGRSSRAIPRQCVFAGTTNKDEYLQDETGARRFWPVRTGVVHGIDVDGIGRDRDQLWGEAREIYRSQPLWWPSDLEVKLCQGEQASRRQVDAWEAVIGAWLDRRTDPELGFAAAEQRTRVTMAEVLGQALKIEVGKWGPQEQQRAARALVALKWKRTQVREAGAQRWVYNRPAPELAG